MTGDAVRGAKFRERLRGYDAQEVDELLDYLASELDEGRSPVDLIPQVTLSLKFRGYYVKDVDRFLDMLQVAAPGSFGPASETSVRNWPGTFHPDPPRGNSDRYRPQHLSHSNRWLWLRPITTISLALILVILVGAGRMQDDPQTRVHGWGTAVAESAAIYIGYFALLILLSLILTPIIERRRQRDTPERRWHRAHRREIILRATLLLLAPLFFWPGIQLTVRSWKDGGSDRQTWVCRAPVLSAWAPPRQWPGPGQVSGSSRRSTLTLSDSACSSHARVRLGVGTALLVLSVFMAIIAAEPRVLHGPFSKLRGWTATLSKAAHLE